MSVFLDTTKRRKLYLRAFVVGFFALLFLCLTLLIISVFFNSPQRPALTYKQTLDSYHYYYSSANTKKIALTFDDGPNPQTSEKIMEALKRNNAPATFFYIGKYIFLHPEIVAKASREGFTIGNHSFTHSEHVASSQTRLSLELRVTEFLISRITGKSTFFYRPPFLNDIGTDPTLNPYFPPPDSVLWTMQNGYNPVGSDIEVNDWRVSNKADVLKQLVNALKNSPKGHVVLLHEEQHTVEAMNDIIKTIRDTGYEIVPLEELLTPPSTLALTNPLQLGDTDATTNGEVSKLQWFLYKSGDLDPYLITGTFGPATQAALTRFQLKNGIITGDSDSSSAGLVDKRTNEKIKERAPLVLSQPALANAPAHKIFVVTPLSTFFTYLYVNFFAAAYTTLKGVLYIALYLVLARCVFMIALLAWWHLRTSRNQRTSTPSFSAPMEIGISVLIPAYNEEENIRATVESVLRSKYHNKEIIVIDDGSTDNTSNIVRETAAAYPTESIRLLSVENGGKASALNHGLRAATNRVCVVLDADSVLESNALFAFARHFKDTNMGAVAGKVCTTRGKYILDMLQALEYAIGQNVDKRALSVLGAIGVVPGPAGAWNRDFVLERGGFSTETLVEDQDMTLTLLRSGKKVTYEEMAIAYTETPHTLKNFLKQRFRWVYGTMQCLWKHRGVFIEQPTSSMALVVMPNIFVFNIFLPLIYPFADAAFVFGLILRDWHGLIEPFMLFTMLDLAYACLGVWKEDQRLRLISYVPLQRIVYRQLLYYTVMRSLVRSLEGTGSTWNKFAKIGETQRFYFSTMSAAPAGEIIPKPMPVVLNSKAVSELMSVHGRGPSAHTPADTSITFSMLPDQPNISAVTAEAQSSPNLQPIE